MMSMTRMKPGQRGPTQPPPRWLVPTAWVATALQVNAFVPAFVERAAIEPIWLYTSALGVGALVASPLILREAAAWARRISEERKAVPASLWAVIVVQACTTLTLCGLVAISLYSAIRPLF